MFENCNLLTVIRANDLQWTLPGAKRDYIPFACPFIKRPCDSDRFGS